MLLEVQKVIKSFPGTIALNQVDFDLAAGEVHAIVGENGAGKSTLMKIIAGVYTKDSGRILIDGKEQELGNVDTSREFGISMIYQELENIQKLTVAENIFLGKLPKGNIPGFVNFRQLVEDTAEVLDEFDIDIDPNVKLSKITTAEQQFIEIIKAITIKNARVIIMDEPTSSLTNREVEKLFTIIRELKSKGISVIYISHRLDEVAEIADRVSVFRDGRRQGVFKRGEFDAESIISMMIGHELAETGKNISERQEVIFEIRKMEIKNKISGFKLKLHKGEILGIAGLMGSGKDELVKSIVGLWPAQARELIFENRRISINHPADAIKQSIIYLPEERKLQSLFLDMSVNYNISPLWLFNIEENYFINKRKEANLSETYVRKLKIKTPGIHTPIVSLSGGNQQKAIFSRLLAVKPKMMILNDPTRGLMSAARKKYTGSSRILPPGVYPSFFYPRKFPR